MEKDFLTFLVLILVIIFIIFIVSNISKILTKTQTQTQPFSSKSVKEEYRRTMEKLKHDYEIFKRQKNNLY